MRNTPMAVLLGIVCLPQALCPSGLSAAGTMESETRRIVSQYTAAVPVPATGTPSKTIVNGPLLGNGDMGVCISAIDNGQRFWLCKNDFWKLTDRTDSGGPRVFGTVAPMKVLSEQGRNCTMVNPWPGRPVVLSRDGKQAETLKGDRFTFKTAPGETIELQPGD